MDFKFVHNNLNVFNLDKSLDFYDKALGLKEVRRINNTDGSFIIVYLSDNQTSYRLELTWLRDKTTPYDLGDNEIHIAFTAKEFEQAHQHHQSMNCICFENEEMGIYFIEDPDGYWVEILPEKK
jgi:lactoylglutathione lyase